MSNATIGAARAIPELTAERLRELLDYDPETGAFMWRAKRNGATLGSVAGGLCAGGYWLVSADRRTYRAHRLAWLYVHGRWPEGDIDHIDGVRTNNRIANLRDVTHSVNGQNQRRARSDNKCGLLGVSASFGRWRAQIMVGGRVRYIGTFDTPELAHSAYLSAKRQHHPGCTI